MNVLRSVALLFAATALVVAGCSDGQVERNSSGQDIGYIAGQGTVTFIPPDERKPAPNFTGPLLDGGEFDLTDTHGDVVVVNVWGSWCPPCRKEAPALQAVYEDLADEGVQFLGINIRDTEVAAQAYEEEFGITYPSIFDPKGQTLLTFRDTLPPQAIPSTIVIDRNSKVAARVLGAITETSLRDLLGDVLADETRSSPSTEGA